MPTEPLPLGTGQTVAAPIGMAATGELSDRLLLPRPSV